MGIIELTMLVPFNIDFTNIIMSVLEKLVETASSSKSHAVS